MLAYINTAELHIIVLITSYIKAGIYTEESSLILEAVHTLMPKSMHAFEHNRTHGPWLFQYKTWELLRTQQKLLSI